MRSSLLRLAVLAVVFGLLSGCEEQVVVDDYIRTQAVVFGTISGQSGGGVDGAQIEVETWKDDNWDAACPANGGEQVGAQGSTNSEADGSYSLTFSEVGVEEGTRCVLVLVTPPSGSGLESASDTLQSMTLRNEGALDSAEVNVTLPNNE